MSTTEETAATSDYAKLGEYWKGQLAHAEKMSSTWEDRAKKVVERYRDERDATDRIRSKFNILWSNVQVLKPSLYGRQAKPEVSRRYMDSDPVGRLASTMLERVLDYETSQFPDFHSGMDQVVEDRLLPGRGAVWMRHEPVIVSEVIPPPEGLQVSSTEEPVTIESIDSAHVAVDYVYWKDFRHSPARTWDEVWWVARAAYMDDEEGTDRFGEVFALIPLQEYKEDNSDKSKDRSDGNTFGKKAKIWEIWDKRTGNVCWVAEGYPHALDEKPDPLQLEGFFCPKPLYATTTNGSLIPVPDYIEYQDQARELDSITGRLTMLVKAVKAVGVFNGSFKELTRLLSEGTDNKLFPVEQWGALSEKGGLKGAVDMLDISMVAQAIGILQAQREAVKQTIYEISGISDILRGSSKAEETLGAQQLKAQFGSMRLKNSQLDVARFASDIFRMKAEIICRFYPPELIVKMSGVLLTDDGKNPEILSGALQLLSEGPSRDFHICVESDSLAQIDDAAEKQAATEVVTAIGGFLEKALPVAQEAPATLPMISEMLLFTLRRFRAGRSLESAVEQSMKLIQQQAAQPKGPSKEQMEAQTQAQIAQVQAQAQARAAQMKAQADAQAQTTKLAAEGQLEQMKMRLDTASRQHEAQIASMEEAKQMDLDWRKANLEAETQLRLAEIDRQTKLEIANVTARATAQSAQMQSETALKTAEMNNAAKLATAKPPEDPAAKAQSEMPAKQLDADTQVRIAELEKESSLGVAELGATGEMFALSDKSGNGPAAPAAPAAPAEAPPPEPAKTPPQVVRREIQRGVDNRITGVVLHYDDGSTQTHKAVRDGKGRLSDVVLQNS